MMPGGSQPDGLDGIDRHPVDGGIEVGDPEPDGAADPDEWNESAHAPVEELAGTDAEVFAGFRFGKQATFSGVGLCLHVANRAVSTERRSFLEDTSLRECSDHGNVDPDQQLARWRREVCPDGRTNFGTGRNVVT
jgi:hypothetical protein